MSEAPYMPFYVGDYIRDTRMLTFEQHGAYLLLLASMWTAGGWLPNDDAKLARAIGATRKQWLRIWPEISSYFDIEEDRITQRRLLFERQKASQKSTARRASGSLGGIAKAAAKALKNNNPPVANATANATANANGLLQQNATILQYQNHKDDDKSSSPWGRDDFERAEKLLREASGLENDPDPTLADISPFMALVRAGENFERVIVPKVRAIASTLKHRPRKPWAYLADAVANNLAEERSRDERIGDQLKSGNKEKRDEWLRILAE